MSWPRRAVHDDVKRELNLDEEQFRRFWRDYVQALYGRGKVTEFEMWQRVRQDLGIREVKVEENLLGREFAKTTEVYADVLDRIGDLKNRRFQIAILSNTNEAHSKIMRQNKIFDQFDHVFLSHDMGVRKPAPEVFQHALKGLNAKPSETLFIDDSLENINAAKEIGMHTILARSPKQTIWDMESLLT